MPQGVVDRLEVIEVEGEYRQVSLHPSFWLNKLIKSLCEAHSVGKTGQRVVRSDKADLGRPFSNAPL